MCLVAQSYLTLCDLMNCSLPDSSVHALLQGISNPGIEPRSPALQADSLVSEPPGKPVSIVMDVYSGNEP